MQFYVLAKCIESEKGDIIIDLKEKNIKSYRPLYQLKEDQEYEVKDDALTAVKNFQWDELKTYKLAFERGQNISSNGFRFVALNQKDNIKIDNNGLLYINNLFFGKLVNQKEVELFKKEGVNKFKSKLEHAKKEGIKLLIKGKKIYRIFTKTKFKNLQNTLLYGQNLLELIDEQSANNVENQIKRVETDLKEAMDLILKALNTLEEIKKTK